MSSAHPTLAHGSWPSPISPAMVARAGLRLSAPRVQGQRTLWLEGRPAEQGRGVVVAAEPDGQLRDLIPAGYSVRSAVNEYGGGAWAVQGACLWFVNATDHSIYVIDNGPPTLVHGAEGDDFADLVVDPVHSRLLAVRERQGEAGIRQALVAINLADRDVTVLAEGEDFYSSPCPSPDGRQLAWLSWNSPDMPWDATRLWLAEVDASGQTRHPRVVAGGQHESVFQPQWGPDGRLYFVSDREDWWQLYRLDGQAIAPVYRPKAELGLPQWVFGMSTYGFADRASVLCAVCREGFWQVERIYLATGRCEVVTGDWVAIDHLSARPGEGATWLAASPTRGNAVLRWRDGAIRALRQTGMGELDPDQVSAARAVSFPTGDGDTAHGLYYPPVNPAVAAPAGERPPLLVRCHGGPTGAADPGFDARIQFWTSRGFAVLDVNYRGSTGFGRDYRRKLYGHWGVSDTEDCCRGAQWLADQGLADRRRLLISGSSAGGFTVLCALTFHETFAAGASYYGVADLESLFAITHRFEAGYDRALVGNGEHRRGLRRARSPLHHASRLRRPVVFFQGLRDRVVPPEQSRRMADALRTQGVPVCLITFAEEGHGFRQAETLSRCIAAEYSFYARILGLTPADPLPPLSIDNLPR
ncbi:MAG: S9 family peptidase [Gammaproteobacteria bacterium]|nr:S9 family peptidase [Gammaproteobacteria bacterium]